MAKVKPIKNKPKKAVNENVVLEEYRKKIKDKYSWALNIYDDQDALTKEVLDRTKDRLTLASTGVVNINGYPTKLDPETISRNVFFLSIEVANDLYLSGIQLANFKPSKRYCLSCKKEIGIKNNG